MAKNFGARKNSKYKVVSSSPSVNKTPRGDSTPDIPYDVQQDLGGADGTSPNVNFNGDPVYLKTSHSTKVTGDKDGSSGGVKSGTVGAQSDPIEASPSVFVNGKAVVRVGDKQYMQGKNTVGKVVSGESGSAGHITDEGKIEGSTAPEPIPMPYTKNKPTNNSKSGSLGSRTGSPVLLASGKLFYAQSDAELIASVGFGIRRTYLSDGRTGMFGRGWQCSYETRLIRSDPHTLSLIFTDDQTFRFTYAEKGFIDTDDLGAKLTLISPQTFLLEYFHDAHSELYVNGFLSLIKDRNGNTLDFVRESNGKLVRITSQHVTLSFSYNKDGLVSQVRDHTHRVWSYTYNTPNEQPEHYNLTHITDPMGGVMHYVYQKNAPYLLERIIDESGVTILDVTYDNTERVESYCESGERFSYRYEKNRVIKTGTTGDKTFYGIDNWGAIRAITYADGSTTKEIYENNISTVIDAGGNTFVSEFDARGRKIREQRLDAALLNPETLYTYEGNNPYPSIINHQDKITTHAYDARYNRLSTTYPEGTTESTSYDDRGNRISDTDTEGVTTEYAYNALGLAIRVRDAVGGITQIVYDDLGNKTAIIDPEERITQFEYDKLSRPVSIIDTDTITTHLYYDNAGRLSAIRDSLGNMTRYAYDSEGFLSRMVNPADQLRTFTRERGRLISITREENVNGEARETTLVCGATYRFEYDKRGRRISQSIGDKTTLYTYDTLGNLLTMDDGLNRIEYGYDAQANIRLERQGDKSVSHAYNLDGSKRFIGYEGMHFNLMRNESGVLERIVQANQSYTLSYNTREVQTSLTYPNKVNETSAFDPLGRLTKRTMGETPLVQYTYDKSSRIISRNTIPITYDTGCRVTRAGDESYTYDTNGNLLKENTIIDPLTGALLQQGNIKLSYDALGQLIEKNSPTTRTTYKYNIEGYLIGYERHSTSPVILGRDPGIQLDSPQGHFPRLRGNDEVVTLTFTYDPLGRRITKSFVVSLSNHEIIEQYHHRYLYAGDNIVAIYDNDTDTLLATLLHEEDAIDSPLSIHLHPQEPLTHEEQWHYDALDETEQFLYNQSRIKRYYYHRDHQNSIIALSDENAQIVEYYEYDIYGTITKSEKIAQTLNPYGYTSREFDTDDLYYYRARYYDPTIGRFITPDPIGFLSGDTNFYRYVGNDPVNFIDPSGLIANMAGALAQLASINRGHSDGNPFNGIVPDTSIPKPAVPNSTIPQGKTVTQASKPKAAQVPSKTAQTNKGDGVKIKGDVPKVVDECECMQNILVWGNKIRCNERKKVVKVANALNINPDWLMSVMALETNRTFDPSIDNGIGYVGLIQFGKSAANSLNTTVDKLISMTFVEQMDYVEKFLMKSKSKFKTLTDLYLAILYPNACGHGDSPNYVVLQKTAYKNNPSFFKEDDEWITKAIGKKTKLVRGPKEGGVTYVWEVEEVINGLYNEGLKFKTSIFRCETI
ncbi:MAG: DUF4150 domain-containing protein [Campylobacterales bacterium]|nr:DUF4150 domain-containing protein [Campylobacterales bacterium]